MDDMEQKQKTENREEGKKCSIYIGNIPEETIEEDVIGFFDEYIACTNDVEVTRQVQKNGKEKLCLVRKKKLK